VKCDALAAGIYTRVTGKPWPPNDREAGTVRAFYRQIARAAREELAAQRAAAREKVLGKLSPAQRAVLPHLLQGHATLDIAGRVGRSRNTVRNHTRAIFSILGVSSRAALVARCAASGVLAADDMEETDRDD
jgi:DNA-binding NarL/FixJ family response regulator